MKIFIDSANLDEIREAVTLGVVDGVTTNPSLIAKSGRPFEETIVEICNLVDGPVSAEVVSTDAEGMIAEGRKLAALHKNVVVKVPMLPAGLSATKALSDDGIRVNVTLIFQPAQGLLAAKAGAAFISPFVGRLDDISESGMGMIATLVEILDNYEYAAEVLVASVRSPTHFVEAARLGADVATIPLSVVKQLTNHPLTESGLAQFLADWEKRQQG